MRDATRYFFAAMFITAGVLHFAAPNVWIPLVPTYLPAPKLLVAISGAAEIAGGVGLLIPKLQKAAAWGLVLLLIAIFPAHIHVAQNNVPLAGVTIPWWGHAIRMPMQALFIVGVMWSAGIGWWREGPANSAKEANVPLL